MPYVVAEPCIDVLDRSCIEQCPVDCIYEGARSMYINPDECVDCGACEPACPVGAIHYADDLPEEHAEALTSNANFFTLPLVGGTPLGNPGGALDVGVIAADTPYVAAFPPRAPAEN
ncbi:MULTISPECIES: ferredoxin [unclassified Nocardioides]|uniref:ferredoxin n=1 Tax=unclassified Nocardioides TaxID=2615069 RepID=UPI0009EC9B2A|nr:MULTISPECIES: ferredoxin [unclassified Nocardioides]